ncbi:MAG: DNA-processing protein DprA [Eubacteriales bacterium]|nr:DNA-processing protein DprA [Eubacteriales bacterium]
MKTDFEQEELPYWLWLVSLPGIGPVKALQMIGFFETPRRIWEAGRRGLADAGIINEDELNTLTSVTYMEKAYKHVETMHKHGIRALTVNNSSYPFGLRRIKAPPIVLFIKGRLSSGAGLGIAVVGSRKATDYGIKAAGVIAESLASAGVIIISGLARGVDSAAHRGALEVGGKTYAVMGCGLDIVYPAENKELYEEIASKGAVISEFLPGTIPQSCNFPMRNRIISGLSSGVVVVEAGRKSGALITADHALEQGKEVFAVPGNIFSKMSEGTNRLISQGAKLTASAADVLDEFGMTYDATGISVIKAGNDREDKNAGCGEEYIEGGGEAGSAAEAESRSGLLNDAAIRCKSNMETDEYLLYRFISDKTVHLDEIAAGCGLEIQDAAAKLFLMEISGLVEQLPGRFYKVNKSCGCVQLIN